MDTSALAPAFTSVQSFSLSPLTQYILDPLALGGLRRKRLLRRDSPTDSLTVSYAHSRIVADDLRRRRARLGNSRFAGFLPDSEVILVVDIAEIPEKRAFRGVCHSSVNRN